MPPASPDFKQIFESVPGGYLILKPDSPRFTIAAVSDGYLHATMTKRGDIVGKGLFEVFPDNPDDAHADGEKKLTASLNRVIKRKQKDTMAIQKYDIRMPEADGGGFEVRYWSPENLPVLNGSGEIDYIIHHVADVTEREALRKFQKKIETESKKAEQIPSDGE